MLCDLCHKNMATVHLTEIVNDKVMELHICQECAKHKAEELKQQLTISEFLGGLVSEPDLNKKESGVKCSLCGISFYDFKKNGSLGCAKCYVAFKSQLTPIIKKVHGAVHHRGKIPSNVEDNIALNRKLTGLRERLSRAVNLEDYEEAARLRDEIRELEKKVQ